MFWLPFPRTQQKSQGKPAPLEHPPQKNDTAMPMLKPNANNDPGLVLWDRQDVVSLLQQFHHSQMGMLQEHHLQNLWLRRWLAWGMILLFGAMLVVGTLFYRNWASNDTEKNLVREVAASRQELQERLYNHLRAQDNRYQGELEKLHQREKDGYQGQMEFLLRLQEEQRKMQQGYEEKIVALEKQNLSLQQSLQQAILSASQQEAAGVKSAAEGKRLQAQLEELKKQLAQAQRDITYWKSKALEKLSAAELEAIRKDLQDDK